MPDGTCRECGEPLPRPKPGRRGRTTYCSSRCGNRVAERKRRAEGRKKPTPLLVLTKVCGWCDRTYQTSRRTGRFCSNHCARYGDDPRAHRVSPLTWRQCNTCGWWRCRGNECPRSDTHPLKPPPDMSPRSCHSCGATFVPSRPSGYFAVYCSKQCRAREAQARRRAHGGQAKPYRSDRGTGQVRRHAIYERDGWRCQLCGRKVDPTLTVPHRKAATLDHIVPVSLGGTHDEANLQLAHFGCNSKKRNKVNGNGEQLRLAV